MLGGEAAEEFGDVFIRVVGADRLLFCSSHLGHCVFADLFVRWPMLSLAILRLQSDKVYYKFGRLTWGSKTIGTHTVICGHLHDVRGH